MVFNGLNGSDLIVYNAVLELVGNESKQISSSQIAIKTNYHNNTVMLALRRLVAMGLVKRSLVGHGCPYEYQLPPQDR